MLALVGNDVVDLGDADNARSFRRPGYVTRVCAEAERAELESAVDPERVFWSFFAAKEAAYKLLTKLGERPGFAHREILVDLARALASFRDRELVLCVSDGPGFVHAVATTGPRATSAVAATWADPSRAARDLLTSLVAPLAKCRPSELEITRAELPGAWDGRGPPVVTRSGAPLAADVSLSHDGRFVAAAVSSA